MVLQWMEFLTETSKPSAPGEPAKSLTVVAAGSRDTSVWVWVLPSGRMLRVFTGHVGAVICGTFAGSRLVTGGEDGSLHLWSIRTGKSEMRLEGKQFLEGAVTSVAAHPT